jgi:hypothetical protein
MTNAVDIAQSGTISSSWRNRIINGSMTIDQRNAGASVTPTDGSYTLDRFKIRVSQASKLTVQQNAGSVTPPDGFTNYLGVTSSSAYSVVSGDYFIVVQDIEGFNTADLNWGSASAKTVTLSFWVRSSLTGTFSGALRNSAANRSYVFSYTINSANTWEYETITIPGDTTGTWVGATNGIGISVILNLASGSTYSTTAGSWAAGNYTGATGATSVVGTNGATFYVTGVQLEAGSAASPFEYRQYGTELSLCQRYFEIINPVYLQAAQGAGGANIVSGFYKATKRATPTLSLTLLTGSGGGSFANGVENWSASAAVDGNGRIGYSGTSASEL